MSAVDPSAPASDREARLAGARRWTVAAAIAGGLSALLLPVFACFMLITVGVGLFLAPVLIPGFLIGLLLALRARALEAALGEATPFTRGVLALNGIGLGFALFLSLIGGGILAITYFGR